MQQRRIELNNSTISAETTSGQGGNITISTKVLTLSKNAAISTSATTVGGGGNIAINADVIALLESRITANAQQGSGGRVEIRADGVFVSPSSAITATSAQGPQLDGVVKIITPGTELSRSGITTIPTPDLPELVAGCFPKGEENSFTISGPGGVPFNPDEFTTSRGWRDQGATHNEVTLTPEPVIIEAQGWERQPNGVVRFVVNGTASKPDSIPNCTIKTERSR